MAELEELEQEELDKNLLEIEGTEDVPLPSVPSASLPSRPGITQHFISMRLHFSVTTIHIAKSCRLNTFHGLFLFLFFFFFYSQEEG